MKLRELSRSFHIMSVKPKHKKWNLKVMDQLSRVLMNDTIGNEIYAPTGTFDCELVCWWIEYSSTICAVVKSAE